MILNNLFFCSFAAIHAEAPPFVEMSVKQEVLETGIKVVDLLAPYAKGGKIGKCLVSCRSIVKPALRACPFKKTSDCLM